MDDERLAAAEEDIRLMRQMRWCGHLLYHRYSLNFSRNKILLMLRQDESLTQKAIMDEMGIQAGSLSEILSKLEDGGLIEKHRCEADKRNCRIRLTDAGRAQADAFVLERAEMAQHLFEPLNPQEKQQLGEILRRLTQHWDQPYEREENPHA